MHTLIRIIPESDDWNTREIRKSSRVSIQEIIPEKIAHVTVIDGIANIRPVERSMLAVGGGPMLEVIDVLSGETIGMLPLHIIIDYQTWLR